MFFCFVSLFSKSCQCKSDVLRHLSPWISSCQKETASPTLPPLPPSLPLYDLTLPITITVRSPQSHVCWHAEAHTHAHAHITGSVFSRFQAGMRYFLKQRRKAELPCLFDCKNMPSPSPRCDSPLLPFCEGRKQNKRHLLPGSTLSTLGPLHNPRKGFKFAARARCDTLKRREKKKGKPK